MERRVPARPALTTSDRKLGPGSRALDEDTGAQCLNALANEPLAFAFDYRLGEARFEGPNTLVAAYTWEGTIDDPLVVTRIEVGPPEADR